MCNNTLSIFANKNSFNDTFFKSFTLILLVLLFKKSCNSRVFYLYMETAFVHRSPLFLFCYFKNRSIPVFIYIYIYVYGNSVFSPFHPSSCFVISKLIQFPFFLQTFFHLSPLFLFCYFKNRAIPGVFFIDRNSI